MKNMVNGYTIRKGDYVGASDNNADEWYVENPNNDYVDRRGHGFKTKKDAVEHAKSLNPAK